MDTVSDLISVWFLVNDDGMGVRAKIPDGLPKRIEVKLCPLGLPISIG